MWREQQNKSVPFTSARDLAELKKTNREKDYPVIGELARLMADPADQLLYSRSARDLARLAHDQPTLVPQLTEARPVLAEIAKGIDGLEAALDAERRDLIHANERRLAAYLQASQGLVRGMAARGQRHSRPAPGGRPTTEWWPSRAPVALPCGDEP